MTINEQPVLVLGGTGKTGRRVADRLAALGRPVRLGSRTGTPPFDWTDRATWPDAVAGVGAVYLSYQPDLAAPGAVETVESFTRLAVAAGVDRVVLLSGRGEPEAEQAERAVRQVVDTAGGRWTVVRASWFQQNFSEGPFVHDVRRGEVALPVDGVAEPFVDADDVAAVAVAALTRDGHAGEVYEVTGPRLLTFADVVAEIAAATGRPVRFTPVPVAEYTAALDRAGAPADVVALLTYLFTEVLDGRNASLAGGVRRALGRPPRDVTEYARATAATGVWEA
ncbi:NmrA family NAD(P)-binding protein [Micromonospora sp. C28SCA-DRY-2]|uniref:NmrA family NAD(P)-binding protein n=1 Tax=Micromonospora sp. C28SCA-DRY-2 TaxID=3059522 RepID=UPI0026771C4A|nr:NmrA family NAD(P)-binding protein [Micromonospora sp. C28SCA-DRY-2]MDO3702980.1 NmrA family NAD(P)-binding protein [Micromonospora sp. C28SCA-DRY-2]